MSALPDFSCEILIYFSDLHQSEKLQLHPNVSYHNFSDLRRRQ